MNLQARLLATLVEPLTAKAAAERLTVPVGRLYHHLDRLLAGGRIRVVAEQRRRSVMERTFQAVAPPDGQAVLEALLDGAATVTAIRLNLTPERLAFLHAKLRDLLGALESADGVETTLVLTSARPATP